VQTVAFAAAFVAAGVLGRATIPDGTNFGLVWPAGGVAVLWLLLTRAGPLSIDVTVLALVAFGINFTTGAPTQLALVLGVTNVVQAVAATETMRRLCPELWGCGGAGPLESPRQLVLILVAFLEAAGLATLIGYVGYSVLLTEMTGEEFLLWLGRNLCGLLVVTTFGLLWGQWLAERRDPAAPRRASDGVIGGPREMVAASVLTIGLYALAFVYDDVPLAFCLLIPTIWVGVRFSTPVSSAHSTVLAVAAIALTLAGLGPFAQVDSVIVGSMLVQFFVALVVTSGLALGTGRDERVALMERIDRAERESSERAQTLDTIFAAMTEGVNVMDESGRFLLTNDAAVQIMGFSTATLPDNTAVITAYHPGPNGDPLTPEEKPSWRALHGETIRHMDVVYRTPDGDEKTIAVSASPLPPGVDGLARAVLVFSDVTAERQARAELAAFARVVAHDLSNPLIAIEGWADLGRDELGDADQLSGEFARELIFRVGSSATRMRTLIRDLVDHALSGERELRVQEVDLTTLVADVVAARNAEGLVAWSALPRVSGDPVLLRQLVDNLVGNGLKYVAPGQQPEIEIRGTRRGDDVVLTVADQGIGLPPGERDKVFREFHRGHAGHYDGTGLGLAIVRRIAARHGGSVMAYDNPIGQGAVFEVRLPGAAR